MISPPHSVAPPREGGSLPLAPERATTPARRNTLDRVGVIASMTCAVHCAATPLLMAASPALGFIGDERIEWILFATVVAIGLVSLLPSYVRRHHDPKPLVVFGIGVAVLIVARTQEAPLEMVASVSGALFVALAHFLNIRRARACASSGHAHEHEHQRDSVHDHGHDHAGHSH